MTFVAAATSQDSIWMVADRRLSRSNKPFLEDANKITVLETNDGLAILGYAGLGATAAGTQPSDWMGRIVRGRNWPLEDSLNAIADGMKAHLPKHLKGIPGGHVVIAPAFIEKHTRLYSIDIAADRRGREAGFRYTRWNVNPTVDNAPRFAFTGSGSTHVRAGEWGRPLLRLMKAHDRNSITPLVVADELARLAYLIHNRDPFTGPKSVVVWRYSKRGRRKGGGGMQTYDHGVRTNDNCSLPMISNGMDIGSIGRTLMEFMQPRMEAMMRGEDVLGENLDELNAIIAKLADQPDDTLS